MDIYKQIKTRENYDKLLHGGMFWEFHPELTGVWSEDKLLIQAEEPKKYDIIYADPAWSFGDRLRSSKKKDNGKMDYRELERHYKTMTIADICALPIDKLSAENSVLFMWTTDAHLEEAIKVINAWGFDYKTIGFIWNKKTNKGNQVCFMGKWTMKGSEICLLATKGKAHGMIERHNVRQLVEAERQKHSQKPDEVRKRITELLGERPRLELFCRQPKDGWDAWGNEIENSIDLSEYYT